MGAEVPVWCRVLVTQEKWIQVSAVTRHEAEREALTWPGIIAVLEASYEPPDTAGEKP